MLARVGMGSSSGIVGCVARLNHEKTRVAKPFVSLAVGLLLRTCDEIVVLIH
jgi:hypothetical protein